MKKVIFLKRDYRRDYGLYKDENSMKLTENLIQNYVYGRRE